MGACPLVCELQPSTTTCSREKQRIVQSNYNHNHNHNPPPQFTLFQYFHGVG